MTIKFQKMLEDEAAPLPVGNLLVVDAINLAFRWKHMGKFDLDRKSVV